MLRTIIRGAVLLSSMAVVGLAAAQFTSDKVSLYKNYTLAELVTANGNDCWGYVSPSGREYAIMGCDNKIAFVDITIPSAPVYFASIPHAANLWGSVKVHGYACYGVTETTTGIQVIDLRNIDNHVVTLVRTINSPQRNHTISVDNVSGFLYTCGSRNGTGTTTAFNLADPLNPVQVGAATMTPGYIHESQAVTYTSGPYAGKQIFFGCGASRGLEIWDFTNKNVPVLLKTVTYPNLAYCHQLWLNASRTLAYLDDELDENNVGYNSQTRVIDVSSLENAHYVGTFNTGRPNIDHNQYVRDGFLFQADYRAGLRIFDTNDNEMNPTQAGWFDTFPQDDANQFNGAWSCYAFFPSSTVIVSDIERGLFILDVRAAMVRTENVDSFEVTDGSSFSGGLNSLRSSDNNALQIFPNEITLRAQVTFNGNAAVRRLRELRFKHETSVARPGIAWSLEFFRFSDATWQPVNSGSASTLDVTNEASLTTNVGAFVGPVGELRSRLTWDTINDEDPAQDGWLHRVDLANWTAIP